MTGIFVFLGLLAIVYSIVVIWLLYKIEKLRKMEFKVLPFLEEDNPVPYYAIGCRIERGSWNEATNLFNGYNPIWNEYQREILKMRFKSENEAVPFLRDFKGSLRDISLMQVLKKKN